MPMDDFKTKKDDMTEEMTKKMEKASEMREDFDGLQSSLETIPEGVDPEILADIQDIEQTANNEAKDDINSQIETAKETKETLGKEIVEGVTAIINDNNKATNILEGLDSKYAKDVINTAVSDIEKNTEYGESIMEEAEKESNELLSQMESFLDF